MSHVGSAKRTQPEVKTGDKPQTPTVSRVVAIVQADRQNLDLRDQGKPPIRIGRAGSVYCTGVLESQQNSHSTIVYTPVYVSSRRSKVFYCLPVALIASY